MRRLAPRLRRVGAVGFVALGALASNCDAAVNLGGLEGGCPPMRGASQVKVTSGSAPFCVNTTEATNAQYAAFVASGFTIAEAAPPGVCTTVPPSTTPGGTWPAPSGEENFPVINVNWCQAYAYCQWAGKRLCGQIGGGPLASVNFSYPQYSQWLNACTLGGARTYPYGNAFENVCSGNVNGGPTQLEIVASHPGCVGAFPGVFDMSGSVWEWTDTCDSPIPPNTDPAGAFCYTMGGAFDSLTPAQLECVSERNWTRSASAGNIGIRCCLDL